MLKDHQILSPKLIIPQGALQVSLLYLGVIVVTLLLQPRDLPHVLVDRDRIVLILSQFGCVGVGLGFCLIHILIEVDFKVFVQFFDLTDEGVFHAFQLFDVFVLDFLSKFVEGSFEFVHLILCLLVKRLNHIPQLLDLHIMTMVDFHLLLLKLLL